MSFIKTLREPKTIPEKLYAFGKRNLILWLSFLVPLALMLTAFGLMDVSPFGKATKQILVTDLWHQYYPFLVDFQDRLQNGQDLYWSWSVGGGVNYFSLMSYYLASPMNFLSVFVSPDYLREFLMISVAVKIALAGAFMAFFLRSTFRRNDLSIFIFGISFSFCAFFMGYYWNTIWLDTVAITPLVALGAVKLLTENKFRLYAVMLALSLVTNYYMAFFSCIFVLLIFVCYHIVRWQNFKVLGVNFLKFAVFTMLGIGMSCFLLIPTMMALQNTHASAGKELTQFELNLSNISGGNDFLGLLKVLKSIAGNLMNFTSANNKEVDGLPNIACGAVPVFFAYLSLTAKDIKLREKLVSVGLVIFMFLSFAIRQLDYLWHGLHFPNMIYYRFSFLVSFVIIVMGFRAFMYIRNIRLTDVLIACALSFATWSMEFEFSGRKSPDGEGAYDQGVFNMFAGKVNGNDHHNRADRMSWVTPTLAAMAVLFLLITVLVLLNSKRIIPRQALAVSIALVVVAQSGYTAYCGVKVTDVTKMLDDDGVTVVYPEKEHAVDALISNMKQREQDNKSLWRAEMLHTSTLNDGALNRYRGLTMFNSMANEQMTIFFENFGLYGWQAGNRYQYAESSPVTHMFLNLKYVIARGSYDKVVNTYDLKQVASVETSTRLYENTHFIDNGFIVNKELLNWQTTSKENSFDPVQKQNEFFRLATGIDSPVYIKLSPTVTADSGGKTVWQYTAPKSGLYVLYADSTCGSSVEVLSKAAGAKEDASSKQSTVYKTDSKVIAPVGYFNQNDIITLKPATAGSSQKAYFYALDSAVFERGYNMLCENVMETTYFNEGGKIEGTIDAKRDGLFYTSIPYEKGWQAFVDGAEVELTPVADSLVAFPITQGKHNIVLEYKPNGFGIGLILSILSALAFAAFCVFTYIFKRKLIPDYAKDKAFLDSAQE